MKMSKSNYKGQKLFSTTNRTAIYLGQVMIYIPRQVEGTKTGPLTTRKQRPSNT